MARHFFFYGTLRHDLAQGPAAGLLAGLELIGPATANGSIYARFDPKGTYPVLLRRGCRPVQGVLCKATGSFGARSLARLDQYEGVAGRHGEYVRRGIPVRTPGGKRLIADTYVYNHPLSHDLEHIRSGDFADWLSQTGHAPFTD